MRRIGFLVLGFCAAMFPTWPVSIQFGTQPIIPLVAAAGNPNEYDFLAQMNPGGRWWDTSAGTVIVNIVPGISAQLILTGSRGADNIRGTADDQDFRILYDPQPLAASSAVIIQFSTGMFAPIPAPVDDSARLAGSFRNVGPDGVFGTADDTGAGLIGAGVQGLLLRANSDAGEYCTTGPRFVTGDAPPAGGFLRSCVPVDPVPDPGPPVTSLTGTLNFTWGAGNTAGDSVLLPGSAELASQGGIPEPSTFMLLGVGLLICVICRAKGCC